MDKKFKIFVIVALIAVTIVAGVGTFIAIRAISVNNQGTQAQNNSHSKKEDLILLPLAEPITANIIDEKDNPHIVRVVISFEVDSKDKGYKKFNKAFEEEQIKVRDKIIYVLRQQTYEMMSRQDAQEKVSDQITTCINELFDTTVVKGVYYGDFFVQ